MVGISMEKLRVAISHAETKKKRYVHALEDGRWAAMGRR